MNGAQDRNRHPADGIMVAILQPHEVRATNQGRGAVLKKQSLGIADRRRSARLN
jgi:hypothetical protein